MRDPLEHHRLAGPGRRDDQRALALAERGDQIDDTGGQILPGGIVDLERDLLFRIERGEIVEIDPVADALRVLEIDQVDLEQGEIALPVLGRADLTLDGIAGPETEAADLARRDIDVVGTRQIVRLGRPQEAETVLEDFQHAVAGNDDIVFRELLQDREHHVLLAQGRCVLDLQLFRIGQKIGGRFLLEFLQIHSSTGCLFALR